MPGVSAHCPKCRALFTADSAPALIKKVQKCRCPAVKVPFTCTLPLIIEFKKGVLSQNKTTYAHWTVYKRDKDTWLDEAAIRLKLIMGVKLEYSRWSLKRVYATPSREYDFANLVGGAKPLIDCLVKLGVIVDDAPKYFDCEYSQEKGLENKTILTLLEARQ